jgi:hypothetical protein
LLLGLLLLGLLLLGLLLLGLLLLGLLLLGLLLLGLYRLQCQAPAAVLVIFFSFLISDQERELVDLSRHVV